MPDELSNENVLSIEERDIIVEAARQIILSNIRFKFYQTDIYPAPNCFLEDAENVKAKRLQLFLNVLIRSEKNSKESKIFPWSLFIVLRGAQVRRFDFTRSQSL